MDESKRRITKLARESQRFTRKVIGESGLGLSEHEMIHAVNRCPGISQDGVAKKLEKDKGAVTRMAQNLERKGYLIRVQSEEDGRQKALYVTEKGREIKNSTARCEAFYYHWLLDGLEEERKRQFLDTLELIYQKSKRERQSGFQETARLWEESHESFEP